MTYFKKHLFFLIYIQKSNKCIFSLYSQYIELLLTLKHNILYNTTNTPREINMNYIEDYLKENMILPIYQYKDGINQEEIPSDINSAITYLRQYANFSYSDNLCQDSPFTRFFTFTDGSGSIQTSELTNEHAEQFKKILSLTNHPFIKAKLYDLLGIITKDTSYKKLAAENYKLFFQTNLLTEEYNHILYIALERSLYLYHITDKTFEKDFADQIFHSLSYKDTEQNINCKYYAAISMNKLKSKCLALFIPDIEGLVSSYDKTYAIVYLDLLDILINYYSSIHAQEEYKQNINKYINYCENLCKDLSPHGYRYIDRALKLITKDNLKEIYDEKINELMFIRDEEQQKLYDSMSKFKCSLDDSISKQIDQVRIEIEEKINSFKTGTQQFFLLLNNFNPITKSELDKNLEINRNRIINCLNQIGFDENHTITFESATASEEEKKQIDIAQVIALNLQTKFYLFLSPFIYNLKVDESLKSMIQAILENNLFVPQDRKEIVADIIIDGFDKNIRKAVYNLISQFEYGIKEFLKSRKIYPVMYSGSHKKTVDLNHMLKSNNSNTKFRKAIVEILGEDLTLALEYLLCNKYLSNLRNNNYHSGYGDLSKYTIFEASAFYFIIEAYCLACE